MTIIQRSLGRLSATTLVALLLTALLAPGCTKERPSVEDPAETPRYTTDGWEGSTYMSLALRGSNPPASGQQTEDQTGGNYQVTWQGDDIIENFAVFIISGDSPDVKCIAGSVTDTTPDSWVKSWDPVKQELLLKPFKTNPANKKVYAFFNPPAAYLKKLGQALTDKDAFEELLKEPIPYMGASGITYEQDAPTLEAFRPDSHIATKSLVSATGEVANYSDRVPLEMLDNVTLGSYPFNADVALSFFDRTHFNPGKSSSIPLYKRADRILSSGVSSYTPEDNITEDQVTNNGRNLAKVYTRRVLAQAVVSASEAIVGRKLPQMKNMILEGLSFQVFNFEPTFYPIAQTSDNQWPGNENTITPRYKETDGTSLINFSTYKPTIKTNGKDEQFNAASLVRDRFFRSSHFLLDEELKEALDPKDKDFAQLLLRQADLTTNQLLDQDWIDANSPLAINTTFWGGCYVTETTHKWGTDTSSGYNTANTPFFAVVAFFDANELPWSDASLDAVAQKKANRDADFEESVKDLSKQLAEKEAKLKQLLIETGHGTSDDWVKAQAKFKEWEDYCTNAIGYTPTYRRDNIKKAREDYANGTIINRADFDKKVKNDYSNISRRVKNSEEKDLWAALKKLDEDREKANPKQAEMNTLSKEIAALKKDLETKRKAFYSSDVWYPTGGKNTFTPSMYEQGINRIFYSLVDDKFYLNYHEIPVANRGGVTHTLAEGDEWLTDLKSKLPNGKDFPTVANEAPADAAVLAPSDVLPKLSQLMNGTIKEKDLSPAERRSMDFYLYGRVAPGLVQYFGGAERTEPMDLHSGYVAWYTATKADRVVSYPCYIRYREERGGGINNPRLMMVYYSWLNPNTGDPSNSCASPVLRNNIYHMHITGFTKMGLSAIPFVPEMPHGSPYRFLNTPLDPDEQVPALGAKLNAIGGNTGQPAGITASSSRYTVTF